MSVSDSKISELRLEKRSISDHHSSTTCKQLAAELVLNRGLRYTRTGQLASKSRSRRRAARRRHTASASPHCARWCAVTLALPGRVENSIFR
jgi:hypothetical protein